VGREEDQRPSISWTGQSMGKSAQRAQTVKPEREPIDLGSTFVSRPYVGTKKRSVTSLKDEIERPKKGGGCEAAELIQ